MTKSNPLFVDSTKFRGDPIGTQIELRKAMVYDDEQLFVLVTNNQGMTTRTPMKVLDYRSYEARVHLNHQTHVSYQFVIERDGKLQFQSMQYTGRAQYAIVEDWEPVLGEVVDTMTEKPINTLEPKIAPTKGQPQGAEWARESSMNVRALMDKWGL